MGTKKLEQDLRDAGLRKKRARKVARAAGRGRAGDRTARELVGQQTAVLRDSVSAVVRYAKPPTSKSAKKASGKKASAKKASARTPSAKQSAAKKTSSKRAPAPRSTSTSAARTAPTTKAGVA
jgi:hypothetical protein